MFSETAIAPGSVTVKAFVHTFPLAVEEESKVRVAVAVTEVNPSRIIAL